MTDASGETLEVFSPKQRKSVIFSRPLRVVNEHGEATPWTRLAVRDIDRNRERVIENLTRMSGRAFFPSVDDDTRWSSDGRYLTVVWVGPGGRETSRRLDVIDGTWVAFDRGAIGMLTPMRAKIRVLDVAPNRSATARSGQWSVRCRVVEVLTGPIPEEVVLLVHSPSKTFLMTTDALDRHIFTVEFTEPVTAVYVADPGRLRVLAVEEAPR